MKMELCLYLYTILLVATKPNSASPVIDLMVDPEGEVCPGTNVTFTCSVSTWGLRWEYDGFIESVTYFSSAPDPLGPFMLEVIEGGSIFVSSTATVTATGALNGAVITCVNPIDAESLDGTVSVTTPPSFVHNLTVPESTIVRVGANQWEFNLEWDSEDCNLEYVITADPPLPSGNCTVNCTTQCRTFTLGRDDPHNFTVIAQNCGGTQSGNASEPLTVCLELSDVPIVSATLTYREVNLNDPEELETILLTWPSVPDPEDPAPGVDGSITDYQISVTGMAPVDVLSSELSYEVDVSEDNIPEYRVSVAAVNILGPGATTTVGPYNTENNLLDVRIESDLFGATVKVLCMYLSESFTSDNCTMEYWSDPEERFKQTGSSHGGSDISFQLTENLHPQTVYNYTVSTRNDSLQLEVLVEGFFITNETDTPIEPPPTSNANLERLSGSGRVATYSCDSALYELEGSSSIEYDEDNGWPDAPTCTAVGWIVLLIILVILLSIAVVILVTALIYAIVHGRNQGAVNLTTPKETVEMKENMSYGPVRVQSQTATQEPVYEEADTLQQPVNVHTGGNVAYGHIRP